MTPIDAFRPLLDWINDDDWCIDGKPGRVSAARARALLDGFIDSFDGSAESSFIRTERMPRRPSFIPEFRHRQRPETDEELETLHTALGLVLERAVPLAGASPEKRDADLTHGFDVLEFDIERQAPVTRRPRGRPLSKFEKADRKRLRQKPGACVLRVAGRRWDLVRYLLLHLLTMPGAFSIARCPAPRPYDWTRQCGRFVMSGGGPGKPRQFCRGTTCKKLDSDYNRRREFLNLPERAFQKQLAAEGAERQQRDEVKTLARAIQRARTPKRGRR